MKTKTENNLIQNNNQFYYDEVESIILNNVDNIIKNKESEINKWKNFIDVDNEMKSKIFGTVIEDIKQEFKNKLEEKETQIKEIEKLIKDYETKYENQKAKLQKQKLDNIIEKIQDFENTINQDKWKYNDLNNFLESQSNTIRDIKEKTFWNNLKENVSSYSQDFINKIKEFINHNEKEIIDYTNTKKQEINEELNKVIKEFQINREKYIDNELNKKIEAIKLKRQEYLELISNLEEDESLKEAKSELEKEKLLLEESSKLPKIKNSNDFFKNFWLILIIFAMAFYDWFFLKKVFSDVLEYNGRNPYELNDFTLAILPILILLALIIVNSILSIYIQKTKKRINVILWYFLKFIIILVVTILILLSVLFIDMNLTWLQIDITINNSTLTELVFRLVMIPFLIVWDFIIIEMIDWKSNMANNIIKFLFLPFYLLVLPFWAFYKLFMYINKKLRYILEMKMVEKKKKELLREIANNDDQIDMTMKWLNYNFQLNLDEIKDKIKNISDIEKSLWWNSNIINEINIIESTTDKIYQNSIETKKQITELIESLISKSKDISELINEETWNSHKIEENIDKAKDTYLYKPKMEKNKIINEINLIEEEFKNIEKTVKQAINECYKKYILKR